MEDSKYGSRKWILAMVFALGGTGFVPLGLLDGGQFVTLALGLVGAFNAADVAQKYVEAKREGDSS